MTIHLTHQLCTTVSTHIIALLCCCTSRIDWGILMHSPLALHMALMLSRLSHECLHLSFCCLSTLRDSSTPVSGAHISEEEAQYMQNTMMVQMLCLQSLMGLLSEQSAQSESSRNDDTFARLCQRIKRSMLLSCNEEHQHMQGPGKWASRL